MASDIVLRSLATPAELDAWFDLCATAFAVKGTPRSHFESHWRNDPHAELRSVFVADTSSGDADAFVSSVRVFARHIYLGGDRLVSMGGIGEVGTRPSHAGRGLATRLLGLALDHMSERQIDVAGLHSSHVRMLPRMYVSQCVATLTIGFCFLLLRQPHSTKNSAGSPCVDSSRRLARPCGPCRRSALIRQTSFLYPLPRNLRSPLQLNVDSLKTYATRAPHIKHFAHLLLTLCSENRV